MRDNAIKRVITVVLLIILSCSFGTIVTIQIMRGFSTNTLPEKVQDNMPQQIEGKSAEQVPSSPMALKLSNDFIEDSKYNGIDTNFKEFKRKAFDIIGGPYPKDSGNLYFDFLKEFIDTMARIGDMSGKEYLERCQSTEFDLVANLVGENLIAMFKMLDGEIKYCICEISRNLHEYGSISVLKDPSSKAIARFLGFGTDFLDDLEFEDEKIKAVLDWISLHWPKSLDDTRYRMSAEITLSLKKYVASVFLQYFIDCELEEQEQGISDENILADIESRGDIEKYHSRKKTKGTTNILRNRKIGPFIIKTGNKGSYMEPVVYMGIVREILFLIKYSYMISKLEDAAEENLPDAEELEFLFKKCKNNFNRNLSLKFDSFYDFKPRKSVRYEGRYVYSDEYLNIELLNGFLGLNGDFQDGILHKPEEQDMSVFNYFLIFLKSFIDEKACYYLSNISKKLPMREYLAMILTRNIKNRISTASEILTENTSSGSSIKLILSNILEKQYFWFVFGLIYDMEQAARDLIMSDETKYARSEAIKVAENVKNMSKKLKKLREELWLCLTESSICDESTPNDYASTRAMLRLWGENNDIFVGDRSSMLQSEIYRNLLKCVTSYGDAEEFFNARVGTFGYKAISLREYVALIMWKYFEEYDEEEEAQRLVELKAFNNMNKDFAVVYGNGERVKEEYFKIVKDLLNGVFCSKLNRSLKKSIVKDDSSANVLMFHLCRRKENTCRFFSKVLLMDTDESSVNGVSKAVAVIVRRILGNEPGFMENLEPDEDDKMLFNSILSHFPKKHEGMKCFFKQSKQFYLVRFIAKAMTDYIKANPVQNHGIMTYLMSDS